MVEAEGHFYGLGMHNLMTLVGGRFNWLVKDSMHL